MSSATYDAFSAQLQAIRRDLHAHPELCFEEHRTSDIVAQKLTEWGIPVTRGLAGTGVVGIIQRGKSTRRIGLRADMDALPMQELNQFAHASVYSGKMHACGHDGHTAMLLGAAYHLARNESLDGTVVLIFQPAEEGGGGAKRMMDEGLFERFPVDAVFGMHNYPGMPVGHFGLTTGPMLASASGFKATVTGKGAHAAQPQHAIDPLMVGVQIAQGWQTVMTRNRDPMENGVLSITQFHAGSTGNVIPEKAILEGTVRTFNPDLLDLIEQRMHDIAQHTAAAYGAQLDFQFDRQYPALINDAAQTAFATQVLQKMVGTEAVDAQFRPIFAAEDFAFMLQKIPGCYVHIGNGGDGHRASGHGLGPCQLHNASYDFNDDLLPLGTDFWVNLVEAFLASR